MITYTKVPVDKEAGVQFPENKVVPGKFHWWIGRGKGYATFGRMKIAASRATAHDRKHGDTDFEVYYYEWDGKFYGVIV